MYPYTASIQNQRSLASATQQNRVRSASDVFRYISKIQILLILSTLFIFVPTLTFAQDCYENVYIRNLSASYDLRAMILEMGSLRNSLDDPHDILMIGQDAGTSFTMTDSERCLVQVFGSGAVHFVSESSYTVYANNGRLYTDLRLDRLTSGWTYDLRSHCPLTDEANRPTYSGEVEISLGDAINMESLLIWGSNETHANKFAYIPNNYGQNVNPEAGPPHMYKLDTGTDLPFIRHSFGFTNAGSNTLCKYDLIYQSLYFYPYYTGFLMYSDNALYRFAGSIPDWDSYDVDLPDDFVDWEEANFLYSFLNQPILIFDGQKMTHMGQGGISTCAAPGDTTMKVAALVNARVHALNRTPVYLRSFDYEEGECEDYDCIGLDMGFLGCWGKKVCVEIGWSTAQKNLSNIPLYYNSRVHDIMSRDLTEFNRYMQIAMAVDPDDWRRQKETYGPTADLYWRSFLIGEMRPESLYPPDFCGVEQAVDPLEVFDADQFLEQLGFIPDDITDLGKILLLWSPAQHPSRTNPEFAPGLNQDDPRTITYHVYMSTSDDPDVIFSDGSKIATTESNYYPVFNVTSGVRYYFGVRAEDMYGKVENNYMIQSMVAPSATSVRLSTDHFALAQAFPNPFQVESTIKFSIPRPVQTSLNIYNIAGQRVATLMDSELLNPGIHEVRWDGRNDNGHDAASGVYFYRLQADDFNDVKKMILMK